MSSSWVCVCIWACVCVLGWLHSPWGIAISRTKWALKKKNAKMNSCCSYTEDERGMLTALIKIPPISLVLIGWCILLWDSVTIKWVWLHRNACERDINMPRMQRWLNWKCSFNTSNSHNWSDNQCIDKHKRVLCKYNSGLMGNGTQICHKSLSF